MIFLIRYDRRVGKVVEIKEFIDQDRQVAAKLRLDMELNLAKQGVEHEVILLEADSKAALRKTHNRYFANVDELTETGDRARDGNDP